MKDELIRKIQDVLDRRITNEKQVVYLLVEIRKLMDRDKYNDPVLRTFSNWVVHTSLESQREGSTFILTEFDQWFIDLFEHKKKSPHLKHISLVAFQHSLVDCFTNFNLKAKFVRDLVAWKKFTRLYCSIVSECPITFKASKTALKYVKQVELTGVSEPIFKGMPVVHWRITLQDGSTQNWGFRLW